MKKLTLILGVACALLLLNSCGMKECKCVSSNEVTDNGVVVGYSVDTVYNSTRDNCSSFNTDEVMQMDSAATRIVHHILVCEEN